MAYVPQMPVPIKSDPADSLSASLMDFLVTPAHAADTVRTTITASDPGSDETGLPSSKPDRYSPKDGSGSVTVGGGGGSVNAVMGAYGYSYPIQIPPGRGGLVPELAIAYNSTASNGWLGLGWDLFSQVSSDNYPSWGENVWTGDFTGDGRSDFLVTPGPHNSGSGWQLYQCQEDGFQQIAEGPDFDHQTRIHTGDFNGDGRTDIMAVSTQGGAAQIHLSNGHGFEPPVNGPEIERELNERQTTVHTTVHLTDFNADGKSDILIMFFKVINDTPPNQTPRPEYLYCISYWKAYLNVENNFQLIRQEGNREPDHIPMYFDLMPGDFNGDGKTDFLVLGGSEPTALCYSSGTDIITSEDSGTPFLLPEEIDGQSRFYPGDFNGDGKTDLLAVSKNCGTDYEGFRLFISTGSGFVKIKEDTFPNWNDKIHTADFNGDGCMDFMVSANINYSDWQGYQLYLAETNPRPETQPGLPLLLGSVTKYARRHHANHLYPLIQVAQGYR